MNNSSTGTSGYKDGNPYISIRPDLNLKDPTLLQPLFFHELMHFVSPEHGFGIEYSYSCEDCCFLKDVGLVKRLACEICKGNFKGMTDPNYLKVLKQYVPLSFQHRSRFWLELFARVSLLETPRSPSHLFLMLDGRWEHDLLGNMWAQFLLKKKIVSGAEWVTLANTVIPPEASFAKPFAHQIINFMNTLYVNGNPRKAIPLLLKLDLKQLTEMKAKGIVDYYQWKLSQEFRRHLEMDFKALLHMLQKGQYKEELEQVRKKYEDL